MKDCRGTEFCKIEYVSKIVLRQVPEEDDHLRFLRRYDQNLIACVETTLNATVLSVTR